MSYRVDKVEQLIKEEISLIFLHKLSETDLGFVTITNVRVSPDLKIAKIYLSVLEKEKRELVLDKIDLKKGFIRSELAHRIRMKFIPELKFFIDDTLDYVEKIEGLIKKIHENDNNKTNEGSAES
ncbi:MAG: 30S ribosome-binding factor RbfA [Ignavibacteriota bacterium]|jgi:ribosome-binding factor A|nr:30S ribosome-binding factor RbfA [Ignavibacteriota bacterium]MBW7841943.1 30S ribosome-binding factor RbfA [Ignavibacterium sp.]MCO6446772.1 30S ribosome-binding factor RbfA [Ignavibacterium album]MCZ2268306.1 30S ribosome-binding factor RbfA [Ignavibacteriales bacterium]MDX9713725.1 30S ribosome-binding factor RbfA [Ignavibacteriaceae bacterium]